MKKELSRKNVMVLCCLVFAGGAIGATGAMAEDKKIEEEAVVKERQAGKEQGDAEGKAEKEVMTPGSGEIFMNIGEVVVTAQSKDKSDIDLPGSVDIIGEAQLRSEVVGNSLELMRRIPGFVYRDYGNGGVPSGFTMRGFNSNHGSDNLVNIDGIPINDHFWQEDGAPDFNQLTAEEVERIDVIKGPIGRPVR